MKYLITLVLAAVLVGCATGPASICTVEYRDRLITEAKELAERQKEIEDYISGKKRAPTTIDSPLTKEQNIAVYMQGYNMRYDQLVAHVNDFNRKCK